jgi:CRP-like cAMP-binding protein
MDPPIRMWESRGDAIAALQKIHAGLATRTYNAAKILAEDLHLIEERFRELATGRVPQRLANVLLRLLEGGKGPAHTMRVRLSCEELAQMTGTTLFTVSRLLCHWADRGIIEPESKAILVQDLSGLTKVAGGGGGLRLSS